MLRRIARWPGGLPALLLALSAGGLASRTGLFPLLPGLLLAGASLRHETLEALPHLLLVLPGGDRCTGLRIAWRCCCFLSGSLFDQPPVLLHPLLYCGLGRCL